MAKNLQLEFAQGLGDEGKLLMKGRRVVKPRKKSTKGSVSRGWATPTDNDGAGAVVIFAEDSSLTLAEEVGLNNPLPSKC